MSKKPKVINLKMFPQYPNILVSLKLIESHFNEMNHV